MRGPGEIWRVAPDGRASPLLRDLVPAALAVSPAGDLVVADRHGARLFALATDGCQVELAAFSGGDAPRGLAFVPATAATRAAGIAGDLLVAVIPRGAFPVNEILRISGPFDALLRPAP